MFIAAPPPPQPQPQISAQTRDLRRAAQEFEAAFLAEMLKSAGVGRTPGQAEDPFASFMTQAQARAMVERGGLGLAPRIEQALALRLAQRGGTE